jgi:hypothetical protein
MSFQCDHVFQKLKITFSSKTHAGPAIALPLKYTALGQVMKCSQKVTLRIKLWH